ncbi:FMN-binding protein [Faecalibacterium gallinarum]|uniref:FMN-binding protein n=1 Tax=Faecalibacterium gallinarum TaxID=2903556 RepID=A0AA37J0F0_9FIRM|nr:FMN-binding protein [Faecalibacterium gallinarum]GJN65662.1 FMN-binding protein [Faecalibacterium gallinarum]
MKYLAKIAAVCALALCMVACGDSASSTAASSTAASSTAASSEAGSEASAEGGYTGTQTASATGMGDLSVTLTFENGVVTDCEIDASNETPDIGQVAAEDLAQAIVDGNTPNVDAVASATITSDAVVEAAQACFDAAEVAY